MARVSVIIPTYNGSRYLAQAIESALGQSYRDVEVIVVNDGSTDPKVEKIAKGYGSQIRYLAESSNQGLAGARNAGIRATNGEFVALLDDDDWWEPKKVEVQIAEFDRDPAVDLVYSDLTVHFDDGSDVPSFLSSRPLAGSGYIFDRYMQSKFIIPSSVMLRRSCFQRVGLFNEEMRSLEDCDFFLRLCLTGKVALVKQPLLHRRQRAGNMTSDVDLWTSYAVKFHENALKLAALSPERYRELLRQASVAYFKRGSYCLNHQRQSECRSNLLLALQRDWKNAAAWQCLLASFIPFGLLGELRGCKRALTEARERLGQNES
jgi:glycosyltransferase involved in cell wall biosynthesis